MTRLKTYIYKAHSFIGNHLSWDIQEQISYYGYLLGKNLIKVSNPYKDETLAYRLEEFSKDYKR